MRFYAIERCILSATVALITYNVSRILGISHIDSFVQTVSASCCVGLILTRGK